MAAPKPVSLTSVAANAYTGPEPKPMLVVGDIPQGAPVSLTPVPASFADEDAVQAYLATLVAELKSSASFS